MRLEAAVPGEERRRWVGAQLVHYLGAADIGEDADGMVRLSAIVIPPSVPVGVIAPRSLAARLRNGASIAHSRAFDLDQDRLPLNLIRFQRRG